MASSSSPSPSSKNDDMMEALLKAEKQEEDCVGTDAGSYNGDTSNDDDDRGGKIGQTSVGEEEDQEEEEEEGELADDEESMTEEDLHDSDIGPLPQASIEGTRTTPFKANRSSFSSSNNNDNASYDKFHISFTADDPLIKTGKAGEATGRSSHGNDDSPLLSTVAATTTTTRIVPTTGGSGGGSAAAADAAADLHRHPRPHLQRQGSEGNLTKISKVERSWFIIADSGKIAQVGERFFLRMFDEYPDLVQLFPFGDDAYDERGRLKRLNKSVRLHIRAHASAVMRVVGTSVAGLTSIEELVPRLRAVGATHKTVGVQAFHYDILFRHLVNAIKEEVTASDPSGWDGDTEEAWMQAFHTIVDLIKRPSKRLETEPVRGWGAIMLAACTYFSLVTPIRFAGFFIGFQNAISALDALDFLCASIMIIDLAMDAVQNRFRLSRQQFIHQRDTSDEDSEMGSGTDTSGADDLMSSHGRARKEQLKLRPVLKKKGSNRRRRSSKAKQLSTSWTRMVAKRRRLLLKTLSHWKMDRHVPWPSLDVRVVLSFILQGIIVQASLCHYIGLHWTQLFGLLRISCVSRVTHFLQCAENSYLLSQKLDAQSAMQWRIVKLVVRLLFITHICACMYCAIARFELGYKATEFPPTPFFPDPEVLYGPNRKVFNSYSRALHWAFVSLSGIGNTESVPNSTLECWFTMMVHMIGAIFYAIVTGTVISILEDAAQQENKMGEDMMKLSNFLTTARMSKKSKDRIMKGFVLRNVLTDGGGSNSNETGIEGLLEGDYQNTVSTLPRYLQMEIGIYARAELLHRREPLFLHTSNSFLVSLSSNLTRTRTLLSGDYLVNKGERLQEEFAVVEQGSLQVRMNGHTIKTLVRGHCIGKSWLLQLHPSASTSKSGTTKTATSKHNEDVSEYTDWIRNDGTSGVTIRATSPCVLVAGLQSVEEVKQLEEGYAVDFQLLRAEIRGAENLDDNDRKAKAMRGIAKAVRRFKERRRLQREAMEGNGTTMDGNNA